MVTLSDLAMRRMEQDGVDVNDHCRRLLQEHMPRMLTGDYEVISFEGYDYRVCLERLPCGNCRAMDGGEVSVTLVSLC